MFTNHVFKIIQIPKRSLCKQEGHDGPKSLTRPIKLIRTIT
jgi:hypothetical protein